MEFDDILEERHSVRSYSVKSVSLEDVVKILHAGRLAPAAGNIHILKFIVVSDKEKKKKLADAAHEQEFIAKAPYVIVVLSEISQLVRAYGERGKMYAKQQAGAAIENMLLKIVDLGMASCWIGAFDDLSVKRILKIPVSKEDTMDVEALIPIAYSASKKVKRPKAILHKIVHKEKYKIA